MTCLISVSRSGKYCCIEANQTKNELQHIDLNSGALILKHANLPATALLCKVGKEWVDSGVVVGGDEPCTVVCKPGCYKLDILCADYEGDAPEDAPVELCYEIDEEFDKLAWAMENSSSVEAESNEAILACLAELKLLTAANNDATALALLIAQMEAICEKLLDAAEQETEEHEEEIACLEDIKELLTCPPATARGVITTW